MIPVSIEMLYQEVREISLRSGKSQARWKSEKSGDRVINSLWLSSKNPQTFIPDKILPLDNMTRALRHSILLQRLSKEFRFDQFPSSPDIRVSSTLSHWLYGRKN